MIATTNPDRWISPGLSVIEAELVAVSGDSSDCPQLEPLVPVLKQLRSVLGMELIFVGELRGGEITEAHRAETDGSASFAEKAYGRSLLQVRCGSDRFASVPVRADDGMEAGTLLCSLPPGMLNPPGSMQTASRLLAGRINALMHPHRSSATAS